MEIYTAKDERTCEVCGTRHEKKYKIDKRPILPFHPNCRCTYLPVINTNNIENSQYLRIVNEKVVNKNDLKAIENDLSMLPESHRKILNEYVKEIRVVKTGNSSFNRITGVVTILEGMEEGELIHELGHALETKFNLFNSDKFLEVLKSDLPDSFTCMLNVKFTQEFSREIEILDIDNSKFISKYQSRVYEKDRYKNERINFQTGEFNYRVLGEYFSEGYKEYILNPNNLKDKDEKLYNFIKELI